MKNSRHSMPQVNAGSMADIAFLLLIFFLVTAVIPKDKGFNRTLPDFCPECENCNTQISKHNLLEIHVNSSLELFVENKIIALDELKPLVKQFLDNNKDLSCDYCNGDNQDFYSDNPTKAVISLHNDKGTSYQFYINIQEELTKAYLELRTEYAKATFNKSINELTSEELKAVKNAYPFKLSEAEIN